jgi:hypothetical protein
MLKTYKEKKVSIFHILPFFIKLFSDSSSKSNLLFPFARSRRVALPYPSATSSPFRGPGRTSFQEGEGIYLFLSSKGYI